MNSIELAQNIQSLSNSELLSILDTPEKYLPAAIEIAKQEMHRRDLNEEDIAEVKRIRLEDEKRREIEKEKLKSYVNPLMLFVQKLFLTFHPSSNIAPLERTIRLVTIVFSAIAVYQILRYYSLAWYALLDFGRNPFASFNLIFVFTVLPISLFFFWNRKNIGWILLVVFLTYGCTEDISGIIEIWNFDKRPYIFFKGPSATGLTFHLLFFVTTIWALCRKDLRELFKVTRESMVKAILFTLVITVLMMIMDGMK